MAETSNEPVSTVILDLRCLQDGAMPDEVRARALELLRSRPRGGTAITALLDPKRAPPGDALQAVDTIAWDGYFPAPAPGTLFINPAPLHSEPVFIARLLLDPAIRCVGLADDPPSPPVPESRARRIAALTRLAWLRRYDALLPCGIDAGEVWAAVLPRQMPCRPLIGGARPRVALLSPFPPARSGVADYSAACVPALAAQVELRLFSATPDPAPIAGIQPAPLSALAHLGTGYDRVVSVLGNSGFHDRIYDLLTRFGAAAICHDSRLLHFLSHKSGQAEAARLATAELGREVRLEELAAWQHDETKREATLLGEVARHAQPLIFHARPSVALIRQRFGADAAYLPFAIPHEFPAGLREKGRREAARQRLGLDPSKLHIASFGFLTPNKGADAALAALHRLAAAGFAVHLHFVGEAEPAEPGVLAKARALGIEGRVSLTGYVPEAQYFIWFAAADIGLQLRNTGPGSISGALADCIAAGLPSVATASLADALDAPDYVTRVADAMDGPEIANALAGLIENRPETGEPRADYCERHSMGNYAVNLCRILQIAG